MDPDAARTFEICGELNMVRTLGPLRRGSPERSVHLAPHEAWRATRTPEGPATERIRQAGGRVHVDAWGPGAAWLVEHAPDLVGAADDPAAFAPGDPRLRELARRFRGLRIGRSGAVLEALVPSIAEQKVPGIEARVAIARMTAALGEPAPGPRPGLRVPPAAEALAATPYEQFHRFGLDRRRAETIRRAASYSRRIEECATLPLEAAARRLHALPGVGPWTVAEVSMVALGDADAVSLGDYHLPNLVAFALAGEPRGTDERMLALLEPYRGHRGRLLRLLAAAGIDAPRRGPRLPLNSRLGFGMPRRVI